MTQRLDYNVSGQVLRHTPGTRRAAATWALFDDRRSSGDSAKTLQSGTATLDAATQAITADAGPAEANTRLALMADTTGFAVGTIYEILDEDTGEREPVEVAAIETNVSLTFRDPLTMAYPTGSLVQGVEFTSDPILDDIVQSQTRMQNDEPMRVVWTFADGMPRHFQEQVRLVRWSHGDFDLARARADILAVFPDAPTRFEYHGHQTLDTHLRVVYRQIRAKLLDRKIHAEEWLTGDQGHFALVWRALWHFGELGNSPGGDNRNDPREWVSYCKGQFEMYFGGLTSGEGGNEVAKIEPVNDAVASTQDLTYRRVFGEL